MPFTLANAVQRSKDVVVVVVVVAAVDVVVLDVFVFVALGPVAKNQSLSTSSSSFFVIVFWPLRVYMEAS